MEGVQARIVQQQRKRFKPDQEPKEKAAAAAAREEQRRQEAKAAGREEQLFKAEQEARAAEEEQRRQEAKAAAKAAREEEEHMRQLLKAEQEARERAEEKRRREQEEEEAKAAAAVEHENQKKLEKKAQATLDTMMGENSLAYQDPHCHQPFLFSHSAAPSACNRYTCMVCGWSFCLMCGLFTETQQELYDHLDKSDCVRTFCRGEGCPACDIDHCHGVLCPFPLNPQLFPRVSAVQICQNLGLM